MGSPAESPKPRRRLLNSWPRLRWPAAIGAWLVIGSVVLGGVVSAADPGSSHLRVTREVSGTVTIVNGDGSKFCLDTDASGAQFCSLLYERLGSAPFVVGEHVTGTVALLATGPSSAMEIFVLTDPQ